jgi:hypothetical protein
LLETLLEIGHLKVLDISDQEIGDQGLELVARIAETSLTELRFDGSKPSSAAIFQEVISRLIDSSLRMSEWPANDVASVATTPEIRKGFEDLKKRFDEKNTQGLNENSSEDIIGLKTRRSSILHREDRATLFAGINAPQVIDPAIIATRDNWVSVLLREVLDTRKVEDALGKCWEGLETMTSLETFIGDENGI